MKFNFKIQQYQTDAVMATVKVFEGQGYHNRVEYIRDMGVQKRKKETNFIGSQVLLDYNGNDDNGFKNHEIVLSDEQLLKNIHKLQSDNNIKLSEKLVKELGRCNLDIEMETGTGKTYVYLKTMFELNKTYGWSKFIVVVPSIAIREGVKKSFEMLEGHFMEHYKKKARYFIYNSSSLNELDNFSKDGGINVMIINTQAFASSLKEDGKSKESRIIYDKRDEFASRRPIDVIATNRPIIILDEPQKMKGDVTQKALKNFNPLFTLNYSATHAKQNNLIYVLDALEAYNKRLVKKIEVKGFEVKNFRGTDSYMYLENIVLSSNKPPIAKIEIEIAYNKSINRETRNLMEGDNLYHASNEMEQYKGYVIANIDPTTNTIIFINGEKIVKGDVVGDISENDMRRIQIRETILSHFEKEEKLFNMGIKTLSLFFIDEVARYRQYDDDGKEILGEYGKIFEQEYLNILNKYRTLFDTPYQKYLKEYCSDVDKIHKGYFSIDKKTGKDINSSLKRGESLSDDISAYDLILKNKERLLSFEESTRFIFSHSALREGWDNPNVFQICTLKHSDSETGKRQEVGRGLRLSVNKFGHRMDQETCGSAVHDINLLTVIANESYNNFVTGLQADIKEVLYDRPTKATIKFFDGKIILVGDETKTITSQEANLIHRYLIKNDYIDDNDNVTDKYRDDLINETLAILQDDIKFMEDGVHQLIQSIFDESVLINMIDDGHRAKIQENMLNDNFFKKEFQTLWNYINHKYAYTVNFDSAELVKNSIKYINEKLMVSRLQYITTIGVQKDSLDNSDINDGKTFAIEEKSTNTLRYAETSNIKYDLIGKIAVHTTLTRKTIVEILKGVSEEKLEMFKLNPEEFISKIIKLIKEQKATAIVEHISYNKIDGAYESNIFTDAKNSQSFDKAFKAKKHIQDYIFTDGLAEKSIEKKFAEDLELATEVCVYAKLPKGFAIPTPVGNYSPDWAIAFNEGTVKHIYFIAETKGSMDSMQLRPIETTKIDCAKKLFNNISTSNVRYHDVDSYQSLLNIMNNIK